MAIDTIARQKPAANGTAHYYRPRTMLRLDVPVEAARAAGADAGSDVLSIFMPVRHYEHTSNSHAEADVCTVAADWNYAGIDPRALSAAVGVLYVGQAPAGGEWVAEDSDIRFVGIMKRAKRSGGEEDGMIVELLFHDYTTLFLEAKKFPSSGVPLLSDTLREAWAKICAHTGFVSPLNPKEILPTTKALSGRIRFVGGAEGAGDLVIGAAVSSRFKSLGRVQTKGANADAWAIWQQCVGMCGLITYIRGDECIVTTATDYYTQNSPPVFVWGLNIASLCEDRDSTLAGKGVILTSFNPMSGTTLESFYPPVGDPSVRRKKLSAKKAKDTASVLAAEDREVFAYPGVTEQDALDKIAQRVFEERSHQELEGRLTTHEMTIEDEVGIDFDLLTLQAGDSIKVVVDQSDTSALGEFTSDDQKVSYLVGLGYDETLAEVVVANLKNILALPPVYLVKRVTTRLDTSPEGGTFAIEIVYCNKISRTGNSTGDASNLQ